MTPARRRHWPGAPAEVAAELRDRLWRSGEGDTGPPSALARLSGAPAEAAAELRDRLVAIRRG